MTPTPNNPVKEVMQNMPNEANASCLYDKQ